MFIPIGDTPNPKNFTPWVNWLLIAVNVGIYLFVTLPLSLQPVDPNHPLLVEYLQLFADRFSGTVALNKVIASLSAYDLFVFVNGYKPGSPDIPSLFFGMFLHAGFFHLAGNMLFLWIFGDNVEHRLGRVLYLVTYLSTGAAATLTFGLFAGQSMVPLVGASGAISGVLGLYALMFKRNKVKVLFLFFPLFLKVFLIPVRFAVVFYILVDNLLPLLLSADSGVAYGAHLGGFFSGLLIAFIGERLEWRLPFTERSEMKKLRAESAKDSPVSKDPLSAIMAYVESGDRQKAIEIFEHLNKKQMATIPPGRCVVLAGWLEQHGMPTTAHRLLQRCLAAHSTSSDLAKVYLELGLLSLERGQPTSAYQHLLSVFDFEPDEETRSRTRAALEKINVYKGRGK